MQHTPRNTFERGCPDSAYAYRARGSVILLLPAAAAAAATATYFICAWQALVATRLWLSHLALEQARVYGVAILVLEHR